MFSRVQSLSRLACQIAKNCDSQISISRHVLKDALNNFCGVKHHPSFHTYSPRMKNIISYEKRRAVKEAAKRRDEGVKGEASRDIDFSLKSQQDFFPTHDLPNRLFDGVPFKDIPIVHVKASKNNTIMSLSDQGKIKVLRSCGCEGFKNARKGTNLAGQTSGYSFALRAVKKGYKTVRVMLRGLGPGRLSALKGLELGGINIISITDNTIDKSPLRPRKQRRL